MNCAGCLAFFHSYNSILEYFEQDSDNNPVSKYCHKKARIPKEMTNVACFLMMALLLLLRIGKPLSFPISNQIANIHAQSCRTGFSLNLASKKILFVTIGESYLRDVKGSGSSEKRKRKEHLEKRGSNTARKM